MGITPHVRAFADQVEEFLDARPEIDRSAVTLTTSHSAALIRIPPVEIEVNDREARIVYGAEPLHLKDHPFALRIVEALLDGRIELEVHHGLLWRTSRSYLDASPRPFVTTRMPVPSLRPRTERRPITILGNSGTPLPPSLPAVTFKTRGDGQIDAIITGEWPVFNEALGDAITSLPPRGSRGRGPSTYWIDIAADGARRAAEAGDNRPFTGGNSTVLFVNAGRVWASYDFDKLGDEPPEEHDESMSLEAFLAVLAQWRRHVKGSKSRSRLPDTYRRNPHR